MASEKRLIDANAFLEHWNKHYRHLYPSDMYKVAVANFPTEVDAVEVVRCGECASHEKEACPKGTVWCKTMCRYMKPDGFCSEGKRSVEG